MLKRLANNVVIATTDTIFDAQWCDNIYDGIEKRNVDRINVVFDVACSKQLEEDLKRDLDKKFDVPCDLRQRIAEL